MTRQYTYELCCLVVGMLFICSTVHEVDSFSLRMMSSSSTTTTMPGTGKTAVIAGASGYIGKSVVRESVRQGFKTIALVRDKEKITSKQGEAMYGQFFEGADVVECDVTNPDQLTKTLEKIKSEEGCDGIDAVVSCLASRSGIKKDAYAIDYQASKNCLDSGISVGARHFVLLSAFCVKNPWLQFQQAKLKFEADLQGQNTMSHTIVRPTAFFKSVSGQLEVVQQGAPFVMFGDGKVTRCNPIAEGDLATYLVDSITDKSRENAAIDLGGPDEPLTMLKQGEMLFSAVGKKPFFVFAPLWLFDAIIDSLQWVADKFESEKFENAAELGRIGKYYAVEDMLTTKPEEKFGTITLQEHYDRIAVEGQEYDPYTTMFAKAPE
ncbi:3,8-divinyl protochlorophyllide a 8-vinyl reductase [Fragilariopsis cylindrus CCMP1102]|uniref:Divinyl chlorophyllide a 8-vinyl-reductase, chloroplastic n=1 Tax=Fragilariopsis cylindrus CCMP1102 TaxID=635003 RepID=A0A1E7FN43_9STRA|nr:3,8-divinyl protochlorophyllide a 8-vinyl reductase [Fragilariopsis cylindrus CCMP1102]|eukprot:OEU19213.1 3,8-divinyl protochlorophyllide a 8-vinyl reductase [Fragilariopsis cylindrus CCMP1102]